jgi:cryptochrome 1
MRADGSSFPPSLQFFFSFPYETAGIELGSNYPRPIVGLDEAKARLHEALSQMWQLEAASRAAIENGSEEGLGDSTELEEAPIEFPRDITMEETEPARINPMRRYEDQMVPSITTSLIRPEEDEESSLSLRNAGGGDSRAEVPRNLVINNNNQAQQQQQPRAEPASNQVAAMIPEFNIRIVAENTEDSTAESSSSGRRERDGGIVPEWSGYSEQFASEENGIGGGSTTSSYLQNHHEILNWRRLSQTG